MYCKKTVFKVLFYIIIRARQFYEKYNFSYNGIIREVDWYGKPLVQLQYVLKNK